MNIADIEHIIKILKQNDVTEFELEQEGTRVKLARGPGNTYVVHEGPSELRPVVHGPAVANAHHASGSTSQSAPSPVIESTNLVKVESPIVGTFYRRPSPDADVFVKEGDTVKKGDTLCIIEAMKLMNEIESPTSGRISKILSAEGHVVEYGESLFLIDPSI